MFGYSLAFSEGSFNGFVGGFGNTLLAGIGLDALTGTIPELLFVTFQMTFAIITVAILAGSIAERIKFGSFMLFVALWVLLVYVPVCHWVWGGGWLMNDGALDFAGGTVVHINAGVAGLVLAAVLGKRRGFGSESMAPSNLALTVIGAGFVTVSGALWIGILTSIGCFYSVNYLKRLLKIDDSLDAFGLHGIGGIIGAVLTGIFVSPTVIGKPLETSMISQVIVQLEGVIATIVYCGVVTFIIAKVIQMTVGLRVSDEDEYNGLDLAVHGERIE